MMQRCPHCGAVRGVEWEEERVREIEERIRLHGEQRVRGIQIGDVIHLEPTAYELVIVKQWRHPRKATRKRVVRKKESTNG